MAGSDIACRVFVGNLSWKAGDDDLREHMSAAGEVVDVNILRMRDGRSKGCAIVTFASAAAAAQAQSELTDTVLDGRPIFVREDKEAAAPARSAPARGPGGAGGAGGGSGVRVYVGNLPYRTSWQSLKDFFAAYGPVYASVASDSGGRSRGWGLVEFADAATAERVITETNGAELEGRSLVVRLDRR